MATTDSDASLLAARAREIGEIERDTYRDRTPLSQAATERARRSLPLGVPSSLPGLRPPPGRRRSAPRRPGWRTSTATATSTSTWASARCSPGTATRLVRAAIEDQLDDGTLFVTPCETNADVAELLAERYRLPMWRFTNSGTEATMDAIRVARGVTGRDKIVKVEGGYHGHHDEVMISMKPPLVGGRPARRAPGRSRRRPASRERCSATPSSSPTTTPDVLEPRARRAATSPASSSSRSWRTSASACRSPATCEAVREITRRHGTLLIFDEVKTGITAGWGGATGALGVRARPGRRWPSRSAAACPIGAFGGTAGVHGLRSPPGKVLHLGTYNGNPLVMAATKAVLAEVCTPEATQAAIDRNRRYLDACDAIIAERRHCRPTRCSSAPRAASRGRPTPVRNYRDYKATDFDLAFAQWLWGINRGVLLPPGLDEQWLISVMHDDDDIDARRRGVRRLRSPTPSLPDASPRRRLPITPRPRGGGPGARRRPGSRDRAPTSSTTTASEHGLLVARRRRARPPARVRPTSAGTARTGTR